MLTRDGKEIPVKNRDTNFVNRLQISPGDSENTGDWPKGGNWAKGTETDLQPWQTYYRALATRTNEFSIPPEPLSPARDVLVALGKYDSTIEELRTASKLPYSRFPLEYDKENPAAILLPHLAALKGCSQVLQLRALAELQAGQSDKALADVKLMLRLTDSVRTEPTLISHLVRIAILNLALQPMYEGLAEHRWSDAQLAELDTELAKLNFVADYQLTMRGELVLFQGGIFDYLRHHPAELLNLSDPENPSSHGGLAGLFLRLAPSGWFYQNQLHCARSIEELYLPVADTNQQTILPLKVKNADATVASQTRRITAFNVMERMLLPALGSAARKFAYGQASVDLARVAIALERYRLAHGDYPDSLDALASQFNAGVPHDIINGGPLHYRRTPDGQFILYSVGWNETDDDGEVVFQKGSTSAVDISQGDWVWQYPAK
jgi:tetratricopeptide (TPR) repeat protein